MKGIAREVPVWVVIATGAVTVPAGSGGTVAVQLVVLWQETKAAVPPKLAASRPLALKNREPVSVTLSPALPEVGVTDSRSGAFGFVVVGRVGGVATVPMSGEDDEGTVVDATGGGTATVETPTVRGPDGGAVVWAELVPTWVPALPRQPLSTRLPPINGKASRQP